MQAFDWTELFTVTEAAPGANDHDILLAQQVGSRLTHDEIQHIINFQINPYPPHHPDHAAWHPFDPRSWKMPSKRLPSSYVSLLRWSNGGCLSSPGVEFLPLFASDELRGYMIEYCTPLSMPEAMPFALNGGGELYFFDMRGDPDADGEFPILLAEAGNLCFTDSELIGETLWSACGG